MVGLGVAAVVIALLGATAYAAWTQGEAAYARGYAAAENRRPLLSRDDVQRLLTTHMSITFVPPLPSLFRGLGGSRLRGVGESDLDVSLRPVVAGLSDIGDALEQRPMSNLITNCVWDIEYKGRDVWLAATKLDQAKWEKWAAGRAGARGTEPKCSEYVFAVSDRTGNVTGP